jgi:hypothetical protein
MLKSIAISTGAAALIAALSVVPASAHSPGPGPHPHILPLRWPVLEVCQAQYDWRRVWTRHGWQLARVYVGQRCHPLFR